MQDEDNYIIKVNLFRLDLPLIKPYKLSYNTFHSFEPLLIHVIDKNGKKAGANNIFHQGLVVKQEKVDGRSQEFFQN